MKPIIHLHEEVIRRSAVLRRCMGCKNKIRPGEMYMLSVWKISSEKGYAYSRMISCETCEQ